MDVTQSAEFLVGQYVVSRVAKCGMAGRVPHPPLPSSQLLHTTHARHKSPIFKPVLGKEKQTPFGRERMCEPPRLDLGRGGWSEEEQPSSHGSNCVRSHTHTHTTWQRITLKGRGDNQTDLGHVFSRQRLIRDREKVSENGDGLHISIIIASKI